MNRIIFLLIVWMGIGLGKCLSQPVNAINVGSSDSIEIENADTNRLATDSLITDSLLAATALPPTIPIEEELRIDGNPLSFQSKTVIFYSVLGIFLILGGIRYSNPQFYKNLFRSFINTNNSFRQVKTQVGQFGWIKTILSLLFFIIAGIYIYYTIKLFSPTTPLISKSPFINISIFSFSLLLVYGFKIGFLYLLGHLFKIEEFTGEYTFNILLINKILALILLPTLCFMIFASPAIAKIVAILSFIIIGIAILNRYARSRESMVKILRVNKFHFFIYLCASEIIPFAIIGKYILASA